jgi:predicted DCC family thiol-disulfide oxidoreductase YuxK
MRPFSDEFEHPVVFFDGECSFCNGAVQFVIRRDPGAVFRFASLQSELGRTWAQRASVPAEGAEATMLLLDSGVVHERSDAALEVARRLGVGRLERVLWRCFAGAAKWVPRLLRDAVYRLVARNRHRLGFSSDTCWLPTEDLKRRLVHRP